MFTSISIAALAALSAFTEGARAGRFVQGAPGNIAVTRLDPLVNPGEIAGHVHNIVGASNFRGVLNSPEEQQKAKCSSLQVQADKSNYWTPQLYFINPNQTYSALHSGHRIYYQSYLGDGKKIHAFPPGFRMLSGLAMRRQESALENIGQALNVRRNEAEGGGHYMGNGTHIPNAPEGLMVFGMFYPSCGWANQSLDSWDHASHVSFPLFTGGGLTSYSINSGMCPETHPIQYPQIFIEVLYQLEDWQKQQWRKDGPNLIFSNGDTTGLSWHADFVSGWDQQVLQDAIDQCPDDIGDDLEKCAPLAKSLDVDASRNCRLDGQIVNEDVGFYRPLTHLPGCNPRWDWDGPVNKPTDCPPGYQTPGLVNPTMQYNGVPFGMRIPYVLPSDQPQNLTEMQPMTGRWGTMHSSLTEWAMDKDLKLPITQGISKGTVTVQGGPAWDGQTPSKVVGSDQWGNYHHTTHSVNWWCQPTGWKKWEGFGCSAPTDAGPPQQAAPAATATPAAGAPKPGGSDKVGDPAAATPADGELPGAGAGAKPAGSSPASGVGGPAPTPTLAGSPATAMGAPVAPTGGAAAVGAPPASKSAPAASFSPASAAPAPPPGVKVNLADGGPNKAVSASAKDPNKKVAPTGVYRLGTPMVNYPPGSEPPSDAQPSDDPAGKSEGETPGARPVAGAGAPPASGSGALPANGSGAPPPDGAGAPPANDAGAAPPTRTGKHGKKCRSKRGLRSRARISRARFI